MELVYYIIIFKENDLSNSTFWPKCPLFQGISPNSSTPPPPKPNKAETEGCCWAGAQAVG